MPTPRIVEVLVRREQKKRRERIRKRLRVRLRTPLLLMTFVAAACTFFSLFGRRITKFVLNELEYLMARGGTDPATLFVAVVFTPIVALLGATAMRFVYHPETETSFVRFVAVSLTGMLLLIAGFAAAPPSLDSVQIRHLSWQVVLSHFAIHIGWAFPVSALLAWILSEPLQRR